MSATDRRIERTRAALRRALTELLHDCRYDTITIQDITERANVGRTTFYLHYPTKDDLFLDCHDVMVSTFAVGLLYPLSAETLLSDEPPPTMTEAYNHLDAMREVLSSIFQGKEAFFLWRHLRDRSAREIEANLRSVFGHKESAVPLELLAVYMASAQMGVVHWWLEKRQTATASSLAHMVHRVQRAALLDAFGATVLCDVTRTAPAIDG